MRYGYNLGCRFGQPHNMMMLHENPKVKWEMCMICGKRYRFNKGYKGRVDNNEYLKVHVRNFAQKTGPTKGVYNRIYRPALTRITI